MAAPRLCIHLTSTVGLETVGTFLGAAGGSFLHPYEPFVSAYICAWLRGRGDISSMVRGAMPSFPFKGFTEPLFLFRLLVPADCET